MSNTIKGLTHAGTAPAKPATGRTGVTGRSQPVGTGSNGDQVTLTDTARTLQAAEQRAAQASGVDERRVAELRAALADGSYQVDSRRVARKLVGFEQRLFAVK